MAKYFNRRNIALAIRAGQYAYGLYRKYNNGQRGNTGKGKYILPATPVSLEKSRPSKRQRTTVRVNVPVSDRTATSSRMGNMFQIRRPTHSSGVGGTRSGGKLRRSRKMPKRQNVISWYNKNGVVETFEVGATTTGVSNCAYLGHGTWIQQRYMKMIFECIFKRLTLQSGFQFKNLADVSDWLTGDQILIHFKPDYEAATAETVINFNFTTGNTYLQEVNAIFATWNAIPRTAIILRARAIGNSRSIDEWLDLTAAKLVWNCKSAMKLQNTTLSYSDSTEDNAVDNVPVYGKQYEGNGTGTVNQRSGITSPLAAQTIDHDFGVYFQNASTVQPFLEPPPARFFTNVKRCSSVKIDPGQIKTSVLYDKGEQGLNTVWKHLDWAANETKPFETKGKFRFFALEHMLKVSGDAPDIRIFAEHNVRLCIALKFKKNTYTDEYVSVGNYVTY